MQIPTENLRLLIIKTTNKLFDPLIKQVKNTTSNANVVLRQVKEITSKEEMNRNLNKISSTVINEVSSDFTNKIDDVNVRLLLLSDELMEVHIELVQQLSDLEDDTKSFVNNKVSDSEKEVKKQIGEMYDRVDSLYKDLENLTVKLHKEKEKFLGKYIIK